MQRPDMKVGRNTSKEELVQAQNNEFDDFDFDQDAAMEELLNKIESETQQVNQEPEVLENNNKNKGDKNMENLLIIKGQTQLIEKLINEVFIPFAMRYTEGKQFFNTFNNEETNEMAITYDKTFGTKEFQVALKTVLYHKIFKANAEFALLETEGFGLENEEYKEGFIRTMKRTSFSIVAKDSYQAQVYIIHLYRSNKVYETNYIELQVVNKLGQQVVEVIAFGLEPQQTKAIISDCKDEMKAKKLSNDLVKVTKKVGHGLTVATKTFSAVAPELANIVGKNAVEIGMGLKKTGESFLDGFTAGIATAIADSKSKENKHVQNIKHNTSLIVAMLKKNNNEDENFDDNSFVL
jgi:hypothetical protein